jgi:hypothetical protein
MKWIPCSERMPQRGTLTANHVLFVVVDRDGSRSVVHGYFVAVGDNYRYWNESGDAYDPNHYRLDEVTHWMELPEPPQLTSQCIRGGSLPPQPSKSPAAPEHDADDAERDDDDRSAPVSR